MAILVGGTSVSARASTPAYGNIVQEAICKVATAVGMEGGCSGGTGPTDPNTPPTDPSFDPKPKKCKVSEHGEEVNSEIKIAFIKFGENAGFIERTFSDGTVTYTATDGASLGVTGGFGGKLDLGKVERGAQVDFGAGVKFDYGSTWTFKNAEEAAAMREQLDDYLVEQEIIKHDPYYAIKFCGAIPRSRRSRRRRACRRIETTLDAEGKLGLSLPFDTDPKTPTSGRAEPQAGRRRAQVRHHRQVDPDQGQRDREHHLHHRGRRLRRGQRQPRSDGWPAQRDPRLQHRDHPGQGQQHRRGHHGDHPRGQGDQLGERRARATWAARASDSDSASAVTVTTANLPVTTAEQRDLVNQWLAAQEADPNGYVSPETFFPDRLVQGDPFQNLMYTNATVSNVEYNNVSDKTGFAAEVKLGRRLRHRPEPGDHRLAGGRRDLPRRARQQRHPGAGRLPRVRSRIGNLVGMSSGPAYGVPSRARPDRLSWPRVLVRMLLVVLPGQLLGNFLVLAALSASGALRDRPGLGVLALVAAGLLAGVGCALVLRPERDQLVAYALAGAGVGIAVFVLLLGLAQLRLPAITPGASFGDFLQGALIVAVVQTAVALPLWWRRTRSG